MFAVVFRVVAVVGSFESVSADAAAAVVYVVVVGVVVVPACCRPSPLDTRHKYMPGTWYKFRDHVLHTESNNFGHSFFLIADDLGVFQATETTTESSSFAVRSGDDVNAEGG